MDLCSPRSAYMHGLAADQAASDVQGDARTLDLSKLEDCSLRWMLGTSGGSFFGHVGHSHLESARVPRVGHQIHRGQIVTLAWTCDE